MTRSFLCVRFLSYPSSFILHCSSHLTPSLPSPRSYLRIWDPRTGRVSASARNLSQSVRPWRSLWADGAATTSSTVAITVTSGKRLERHVCTWDRRNLSAPAEKKELPRSVLGVPIACLDKNKGLLVVSGRGHNGMSFLQVGGTTATAAATSTTTTTSTSASMPSSATVTNASALRLMNDYDTKEMHSSLCMYTDDGGGTFLYRVCPATGIDCISLKRGVDVLGGRARGAAGAAAGAGAGAGAKAHASGALWTSPSTTTTTTSSSVTPSKSPLPLLPVLQDQDSVRSITSVDSVTGHPPPPAPIKDSDSRTRLSYASDNNSSAPASSVSAAALWFSGLVSPSSIPHPSPASSSLTSSSTGDGPSNITSTASTASDRDSIPPPPPTTSPSHSALLSTRDTPRTVPAAPPSASTPRSTTSLMTSPVPGPPSPIPSVFSEVPPPPPADSPAFSSLVSGGCGGAGAGVGAGVLSPPSNGPGPATQSTAGDSDTHSVASLPVMLPELIKSLPVTAVVTDDSLNDVSHVPTRARASTASKVPSSARQSTTSTMSASSTTADVTPMTTTATSTAATTTTTSAVGTGGADVLSTPLLKPNKPIAPASSGDDPLTQTTSTAPKTPQLTAQQQHRKAQMDAQRKARSDIVKVRVC